MKVQSVIKALPLLLILSSCKMKDESAKNINTVFSKDTACITLPMRFESNDPDKSFVTISFKDCKIDSIHWEKGNMGVVKDIVFSEFVTSPIKPSKSLFSCDIIAGKYAWVKFNDCITGRGYLLKLPFEKEGVTGKYISAINNFDPKFKVADGLVAYYDNTFILVRDMQTDKVGRTLLTNTGIKNIDYNNVHSLIDSVNITKEHIYAKLKIGEKDIELDKPLTFK